MPQNIIKLSKEAQNLLKLLVNTKSFLKQGNRLQGKNLWFMFLKIEQAIDPELHRPIMYPLCVKELTDKGCVSNFKELRFRKIFYPTNTGRKVIAML